MHEAFDTVIPLKLQLKNFLSYGADVQTIDFAPHHLICLSGKNGHGKSALLDAITWALWGQARKTFGTAKADQGLLRLGQTQMFVALDFSFNGQTYRVRREFAKTYGKPITVLDFGVFNDNQELMPLTDKTIRQTQEKIESLLNLDMDSFINSAFLRQGQSNEFSKKTAKERKNVLASILGLNRYEVVRTLALEKIKHSYAQLDAANAVQIQREQELGQLNSLMEQLHTTQATIAQLHTQETVLMRSKQELATAQELLHKQEQEAQLLIFKQQQLEQRKSSEQHNLRTLLTQWRMINNKMRHLPDTKQLEIQKRELLAQINAHQLQLQKSLEIKEKLLGCKQQAQTLEQQIKNSATATITAKKVIVERLTVEQQSLQRQDAELSKQRTAHEQELAQLKQEIVALQKKVLAQAEQQMNLEAVEKQFERRKSYYQKFAAQGTWITQEIENLKQKDQLVHDDNDNPSCPLCDQNLSANRKRFLKKRFETELHMLSYRINRLRSVTTRLKDVLMQQHAQLTSLKKQDDEAKAHLIRSQDLGKQVHKIELALAHIGTTQTQLQTTLTTTTTQLQTAQQELVQLHNYEQQLLTNDQAYQEVMRTVRELEAVGSTIIYDAQSHQHAMKTVQTIEQTLQEVTENMQQAAAQEQRSATVRQMCGTLKQLKTDQTALMISLTPFTTLPEQRAMLVGQQEQLTVQEQQLRSSKEAALQEKGKLEQQQQRLATLKVALQEHTQQVQQLNSTISDYQAIATATGKDGIQALLIEEAIPEIEQEANGLLSKLTGNQAQIFIESLRDLKSGGTKETLDIKISDAVGIRPYEMFSGGEAFRIDFALRIAISKLLARRAGTSLQTLIIDEGFGSQDEEGLSTIMDALYKIQEDFCKVIIVSHLPAMKDQFPVHFVVEKGPNGSQVKILEQG